MPAWAHASLLPTAFQKVWEKYFKPGKQHKQMLFVSFRESDMTEIPASLDFLLQGNSFFSCFLEVIGILALLTHQNISLYLSVLQAVQPILSSSNNRQCRQKLKPEPALLMDDLTLHFPAPGHFNQSAGLIRRKCAVCCFPHCFFEQD